MRITKNHIKFSSGIIGAGLLTPLFIEYTKDFLHEPIVWGSVVFFLTLYVLFTSQQFIKLRNIELEQENKRLKNEYRLIREAKHLIPKDFQFREMQPGEVLKNSERPYFKTYIDRKAIPYGSDSENKSFYTEQSLAGILEQGNNILLIGSPTEGKTRTLFEALKKLNDFLVISLPINRQPTDEALQLLEGKKVIWLFDDLNTYESNAYDFQHTFGLLKEITSLCVLAATCRDGPELRKSVEGKIGQLHKIYDLFDFKLTLESAKDDQKEELKKAVNETETRIFPTLGSICMRKHFVFMRDRFDVLPELDKNSLRSIALLFSGYIYPFTPQRIRIVLTDIFGHEKNNIDQPKLRASLNNLVTNGFIISPKDVYPIIPEAAYITEPEITFYYPTGHDLQNDKAVLINCLKKEKDADGLNRLANSYYFLDKKDLALTIWNQTINEFKYSNDITLLEQVTIALYSKGFTLGQRDEHEKAIQCYDDLVDRFGNNQVLVLQENVAKALVNKGFALGQLGKSENEIKCYDDLINRFDDSPKLVLQKNVAKALYNKGVTLGQINESKEAIQCYDDLVKRFGNSQELVLQELVAKAIYNKGITHGQLSESKEAIRCHDDLIARFGDSQELVLQEQFAKALVNKGFAYGQLNESCEAIQCCSQVIQRFGKRRESIFKEVVASAYELINSFK